MPGGFQKALPCLHKDIMSYPYIAKRVVNAGTEEEPDFREMPFLTWIPGKDRGPYKQCRACRELRDTNPKVRVGYSIPGSANCAKHIIRFHKKNGTWTEELEADVLRREEINEKSRKGAYYNTD